MEQFIKKLFEAGEEKGFEDQEVYYQTAKNFSVSVYKQAIDKYSLSENGGMSYRALVKGKVGYAYTEKLTEDSIPFLIDSAYENALVNENDDLVVMHDGSGDYKTIDMYNPELEKVEIPKKIDFLMELEKMVEAKDSRIHQVTANTYQESEVYIRIVNTKGLNVEDRNNYCFAYAVASAKENGDTRTGMGYQFGSGFEKLSCDKIADDASREALNMLGAKTDISKTCPVVFKNDTFAELMSTYNGVYSAESVHKNLSKLKGKIGEKIASESFTLIDDPHMPDGIGSSSFDAEGVATYCKAIVEDGKLLTYLHNLKTATKDGVASTGNASKGSYKGTLGISPTNIYLKAGDDTAENIIGSVKDGYYLTGLQGLHAGVNAISGDFSLQCYGYKIVNGKLDRPVSQITVAGNYFEMIQEIEMIANDLTFTIMGSGYMGTPTVKIRALSISGE